jgi:hypothetical protein
MERAALLAAHHEAAHAVVGRLRGQFVRDKGLVARADGTGSADVRRALIIPRLLYPPQLVEWADAGTEMECAMLLAGYLAEWRVQGQYPPGGAAALALR